MQLLLIPVGVFKHGVGRQFLFSSLISNKEKPRSMPSLCVLIVNSWWVDQSSDLFPAWWLTSFCQGCSSEWRLGSLESPMRNWVLVWNLWNSDSGWMGFNHYWTWTKLESRATSKPSALLEVIKNILPPAWLPEGISFVEGGLLFSMWWNHSCKSGHPGRIVNLLL